MFSGKTLVLCLCLEDVGNFDILLSQIGAGDVFGRHQRIHLILQGRNKRHLDALTWDIQDCAFPLITGISTCTSLCKAQQRPDLIMVLLADRPLIHVAPSPELLGLVQYSTDLAIMFGLHTLGDTKVVVLGDLAHTAASLLTSSLDQNIAADQVLALEWTQGHHRGQGHLSKVTKMCEALTQWWAGAQNDPDSKAILGTKFVDTKSSREGKNTVYFFSAQVDFSGPMTFRTSHELDLSQGHMSKVIAETDLAHHLSRDLHIKAPSPYISHL